MRRVRLEASLGDRFTCSICGEEHEGLTKDWAYGLPDVVWELSAEERAERAQFNNDLCQLGERYFIRCMLEVPFTDAPDRFGWGAWVEVNWPTFERYLEIYDQEASSEPQASGVLANHLSPYSDSLGTPVIVTFRDAKNRPTLSLEPHDTSRLAMDQRNGIDAARYHEILSIITAAGDT